MPLYIAKSGDLDRGYRCLTDSLTHSLTTLTDRATQLLIKYKSGALVTQYNSSYQVHSYEMELETTIDKLNKATEEFEEKDAQHMEVDIVF